MHNCIFNAYCTENFCDRSCPTLAETSYLLERNNIDMNSSVFQATDSEVQTMLNVLNKSQGKLGAYIANKSMNTVYASELLTYVAICSNWQGSRLHCDVYNLKYSKYVDELKKSWSLRAEPEDLEYMRIWSESAKILIISNIDYVNFGDFESQTLLNLLQTRQIAKLTTIFVTPSLGSLVSSKSSSFFSLLKSQISEAVKVVSEG